MLYFIRVTLQIVPIRIQFEAVHNLLMLIKFIGMNIVMVNIDIAAMISLVADLKVLAG